MKYLRAGLRLAAGMIGLPVFAGLVAVQNIVAPLTGNYTVIPGLIYGGVRKLLGYKVVFNAASAPVVKDKPVWSLLNHLSGFDAFVVGGKVDGAFVGRQDLLKWPAVSQLASALGMIRVRRKAEFNAEARGKIVSHFNRGGNVTMFPEGATSDGKQVLLFRAGLLTLLFGDAAADKKKRPVTLQKDVVVQPIALRVKSVDGVDARGNDELRNLYSMPDMGAFQQIWKRLQIRSTVFELTVLPALDPQDFKNAKDLANRAGQDVASIVNPGQKGFAKGFIPGHSPA